MNWLNLLSAQREGKASGAKPHDPVRSPFDQDFDRIIFSHPFRRLQDKTQVFPMPEHDFVHTRLTHSLEVSVVGRSLGKAVGAQLVERHPELKKANFSFHDFGAIVAAAALTHDIGNPPFGHSGESALSDFFIFHPQGKAFQEHVSAKEWADLINFEGNAQGFRLMNKNSYEGLKLTYASLAAFTKYPRESSLPNPDKSRRSQKKYGFFQSERVVFEHVAQELSLQKLGEGDALSWTRHPLAFLVEAADDICYNLIDLEDGCRLGLVSFEEVKDWMAEILGDKFRPEKVDKLDNLNEKLGQLRAMAIGELIGQTTSLFLDHEQDLLAGSFDKSLTDEIPCHRTLQSIVHTSIEKIYRSRQVLEKEAAGFEVLGGLLEAFAGCIYAMRHEKDYSKRHKSIFLLMPPELNAMVKNKEYTDYQVLRECLDHISGMTDRYAIGFYRKIKGMTLS
ncbi:deoxyguanosinetriphosphate triphosphohydrolase [Cytophagales bacterium LB-30]|uniref:Deoxyguanosinetriphosphate triphosphohydrolase n=1 Tax=Shiella aurantiaca TaxID=3058365 RepID=A0ABT8F5Y5_9BACT|nr:deoxyguanosinetriphosphate triphosphohydrolase [Shiella aurantiaca]MDN4165800.1 deoxyguanosinetriphosphate triphosphohydrolase [Shiella aurantiaca]